MLLHAPPQSKVLIRSGTPDASLGLVCCHRLHHHHLGGHLSDPSSERQREGPRQLLSFHYTLSLNGEDIARLVAPPFEVSKNSSVDFRYLVQSSPIPLGPEQAQDVDLALKRDYITLDLKGSARVRWRVGRLGSVRFLCHLDCHLHFLPSNGTYIPSRCTSNAK
ncbi:hypothetical protein V6N13_074615 [Hibiscus sabdariffa]